MADEAKNLRSTDSDRPWGEKHLEVVKAEIAAINTRRDVARVIKIEDIEADKTTDVVGLALSGGGLRSSAVCLGVLQALNHHDLIRRIDYLSTVAGGGYIGCSFTATMTQAKEFAFAKPPGPGSVTAHAAERRDTPAVGHIRSYANYLMPGGPRDLLTGMAIVVRGLVANLSLILPLVLLLAATAVLSNPARSSLYVSNFFGFRVSSAFSFLGNFWSTFAFALAGFALAVLVLICGFIHHLVSNVDRRDFVAYLAGYAFVLGVVCNIGRYLNVDHFALTVAAAIFGIQLFLFWALWRGFLPPDRLQEFRSQLPTVGATYLIFLGSIGFFELQPFVLAEMFDVAEGNASRFSLVAVTNGGISYISSIGASVAAGVALFRRQLAEAWRDDSAASAFTSRAFAMAARAIVWLAGAAILFFIWGGFLYLSYWGIANDKVLPASDRQYDLYERMKWNKEGMQPASANAAGSLSGNIQFNSEARTLSAEIGSKEANPSETNPVTVTSHIPGWLLSFARPLGLNPARWSKTSFGNNVNGSVAILYIAAAFGLFFLSWFFNPNANSLYRLYRDRLSKAFLFDPRYFEDGGPIRNQASIDQGRDFLSLDRLKLSALCPKEPAGERKLQAPYHLINTALNIQGSNFASRRGRSADFFVFSPLHVGSEATGYANTVEFEHVAPGLDLATAMAVSGAAASSANRRSSSIEPLTLTLTLLNVRFGYWLKNPRYVSSAGKRRHGTTALYLWSEIAGRLYEDSESVYLTHGGHIENLGVYELLRRRCKVIISIDVEADAPMNFSALMTLQRYARIDLGILIDLPWAPIRARTLELMNSNAGKAPSPAPTASDGPHVAVGVIDYGGGEKGYLVYIKSSLSGDEDDYIRDYARRNDRFPHETTGDQFFSAEQFEVYRTLGFHMTHGFLSGDHDLAVGDGTDPVMVRFTAAGVASIDAVRAAFGLPVAIPSNPV